MHATLRLLRSTQPLVLLFIWGNAGGNIFVALMPKLPMNHLFSFIFASYFDFHGAESAVHLPNYMPWQQFRWISFNS